MHAWVESSSQPQRQKCVAFLPFGPWTVKALKPLPFLPEPGTLGEHVKRRCLELGLRQVDVASRLGVSEWTILNWERGKTVPAVGLTPRIIEFLGYDPHLIPETLGQRLVAAGRVLGLSRKRLAKLLGIDEGTVRRWEGDRCKPGSGLRPRIAAFLVAHGNGR